MFDNCGTITFTFDYGTKELLWANLLCDNAEEEKIGREVFVKNFSGVSVASGLQAHNFKLSKGASDLPARVERTWWRDQQLSELHRLYGIDLPALDLDCIFLEYDQGDRGASARDNTQ